MVATRYTQIVNEACAGLAEDPDQRLGIDVVHDGLDALAKAEPEDATLRALADACAYHMLDDGNESPVACGPYEPMFYLPHDDGARVYPVPLDSVEADVLDIWRDCAVDESLHPLVRSRLADLLWVRRHDQQSRWFEVAVASYVDLAATDAEVLDREGGLCRAVGICKESNHRSLMSGPTEALRHLVRQCLDTADDKYGVVIRALQALAGADHACSDLIEDAIARFGDDPWQVAQLCEIAIQASPDDHETTRLRLQQIQAYTDAAAQCDGLLRLSHLEDARSIASAAGLTDEERRIATMIEQTDLDDAWHTTEVSVDVDRDEIRSYLDAVVGDDDLTAALQRFGWSIPTGDPDKTRAFLVRMANEHPLQFLLPMISVGPDNTITRIPSGHPLRDDMELGKFDAQAIDLFATTRGKLTLDAINERYSPDPQTLLECFTCDAIPEGLAKRIAVSHTHWQNQDHISAVSVLVLTIEGVVRRVCRQAGIHTTEATTTSTGDIPIGQVRSLGRLIRDLQHVFGPIPTRYLEAALVDRWSLNLRNSLAHVLAEELTEPQYVVLFHVACMLRLMSTSLSDRDG